MPLGGNRPVLNLSVENQDAFDFTQSYGYDKEDFGYDEDFARDEDETFGKDDFKKEGASRLEAL